jgi:hypothetical protein
MDISPPTSEELDAYPHVFFTSDMTWYPQVIDDEYFVCDLDIAKEDMQFTDYHPATLNDYGEVHTDFSGSIDITVILNNIKPQKLCSDDLVPNFGFVPKVLFQHTLDHATQFTRLDTCLPLRKHFQEQAPCCQHQPSE